MPSGNIASRKEYILNAFQDFLYATKSSGICMVDSNTGGLVFSFGFNPKTKQLIKDAIEQDCFSNFNAHVGAFFINKRELDFIQVCGEDYDRFIKVIDQNYFLYAYFKKDGTQDYSKIKFHLNSIKSGLVKIHA